MLNAKKLWLTFIVIAVITFVVTFLTAKLQNTGILLVWLLVLAIFCGWAISSSKKKKKNRA